jgi:type II secretory pathway pseudopilin PulG
VVTSACRHRRSRHDRASEAGFTLLEVLIAVLLGMIGLIGTLAVQQTVFNATVASNDGAVALRLATRVMEEFNTKRTVAGAPPTDQLLPLSQLACSATWCGGPLQVPPPLNAVDYLDALGNASATFTPTARFMREWRVVDRRPVISRYNVSVRISYAMDGTDPAVARANAQVVRAVRLDAERNITW